MKPYYSKGGIEIYHGNFREGAELAAAADLILADTPYGETSLEWDGWIPDWPSAIPANCPMWCFGSARMFFAHANEFGKWRFVQDVVWEKHNGSNFINDRFKRVHESAYQFIPSDASWALTYKCPQMVNEATKRVVRGKTRPPHTGKIWGSVYISEDGGPKLMRSVIYSRSCHGYAENETQKPTEVVGILMRYSCPVGGLVFSPFMGSGTDLVTAKAHGMRAIGFDVREEQCEVAAQRLSQEVFDFAEEK